MYIIIVIAAVFGTIMGGIAAWDWGKKYADDNDAASIGIIVGLIWGVVAWLVLAALLVFWNAIWEITYLNP